MEAPPSRAVQQAIQKESVGAIVRGYSTRAVFRQQPVQIERAASVAPIRRSKPRRKTGKSFFEPSFLKGTKLAEVQVDAQGNKLK
jgi:hypothetical protein